MHSRKKSNNFSEQKKIEIYHDEKFHYRIIKKGIYLDRMRRKEIMQGTIKDVEFF